MTIETARTDVGDMQHFLLFWRRSLWLAAHLQAQALLTSFERAVLDDRSDEGNHGTFEFELAVFSIELGEWEYGEGGARWLPRAVKPFQLPALPERVCPCARG